MEMSLLIAVCQYKGSHALLVEDNIVRETRQSSRTICLNNDSHSSASAGLQENKCEMHAFWHLLYLILLVLNH